MAFKEYYSEEEYREIWDLTGFWHGYDGISPFFPERIDNLEVNNFLCRYDQRLPVGEGVQLFMEIQYTDKKMFDKEYEKIKSMAFECNEFFDEMDFSAYAVRLIKDDSTEYALIDEKQQIIYYIFLHCLPKEEIEFEDKFVPSCYVDYWDKYFELKKIDS